MGKASRKKQEISQQRDIRSALLRLKGDEAIVAATAITVFEKIVIGWDMVNGCYNLSFFLSEYLKREYGIHVERRFGWVTNPDCLKSGMAHAWIFYNDKLTDLSIHNNERPDITWPGPVLVQGLPYRAGKTSYIYSEELPPINRKFRDAEGKKHPAVAEILKRHEDELQLFKTMSSRDTGAEDYFSYVDDEMTSYDGLKRLMLDA